jgi:hypothetical protein
MGNLNPAIMLRLNPLFSCPQRHLVYLAFQSDNFERPQCRVLTMVCIKSNTRSVTSGARTAYPSGSPEFTTVFVGVQYLVVSAMFCKSLYFCSFSFCHCIVSSSSSNLSNCKNVVNSLQVLRYLHIPKMDICLWITTVCLICNLDKIYESIAR